MLRSYSAECQAPLWHFEANFLELIKRPGRFVRACSTCLGNLWYCNSGLPRAYFIVRVDYQEHTDDWIRRGGVVRDRDFRRNDVVDGLRLGLLGGRRDSRRLGG